MSDFLKRALNFGIRHGLSVSECKLAFSTGVRCSYSDYLEICEYFKMQEHCDRYSTYVEYN